jgi:hypothetical protein
MNAGGFSWKRFLGLSAAKGNLSKAIGVPLTKSGRQQKVGRLVLASSKPKKPKRT